MIDAEEEGDRLSADELFANAVLLIAAGHLTTAGLIGNGLLTLLQHRDALDALLRDPSLIRGAVEEMLRFESPIQATGRRLTEDVEMGGKRLRAGELVLLHLGAANREPVQFDRPDRFDITRVENRHLAFSHGIHFCLGAALARLEGQIALSTLLQRFPKLRLDGDAPPWETDLLSRGVGWLNIALS
jgi:cytochrome P450